MDQQQFKAGQGGGSDCLVTAEARIQGGQELHIRSKVAALYQRQIEARLKDVLRHFDLQNIQLDLQDEGALDFVLSARIEAALTAMDPSLAQKPYSLSAHFPAPFTPSSRLQSRRSRLYLPGNSPKLMLNAAIHQPDGLILDLEDAVAPSRKHEARYLVRHALMNLDFMGAEKMVRINQLPLGLEDLPFAVPAGAQLILLPKCESAAQVISLDAEIRRLQKQFGLEGPVWIMPIIESALGVVNAYPIASASPSVAALAIGLEDYTADIGALRSTEAWESFYARGALVNAARAAGVQAIDSVFSDVSDMDALARNVQMSKSLGFDGMGCIHPRQIRVIHGAYAPDKKELDRAKAVCLAFDEAQAKGLGVVSLGSKMIDAPVVRRARHTIETALKLGLLETNWKEVEKNPASDRNPGGKTDE